MSLADAKAGMTRYPQRMINVSVARISDLDSTKSIWDAVGTSEKALAERGRVLLRPSGTEPLIRVMVEAETQELVDEHVEVLAEIVRASLS
jgi:phosphoglucosamine mutase